MVLFSVTPSSSSSAGWHIDQLTEMHAHLSTLREPVDPEGCSSAPQSRRILAQAPLQAAVQLLGQLLGAAEGAILVDLHRCGGSFRVGMGGLVSISLHCSRLTLKSPGHTPAVQFVFTLPDQPYTAGVELVTCDCLRL